MSLFKHLLKHNHYLFHYDFIRSVIGIKDTQWVVEIFKKYCVLNSQGLENLDYVRLLDYVINLKSFSEKSKLNFAELCLIEQEINNIPKRLDLIINNNFKNPSYEKF